MRVEVAGKIYDNEDPAFLEALKKMQAETEAIIQNAQVPLSTVVSDEIGVAALPLGGSGGFTPTAGQSTALAAVNAMMAKPGPAVTLIKGYAGTGKTTMLRLLGKLYRNPIVVTPTGKAALRVQEATGMPAGTVHRWLYETGEDPQSGKMSFVPKKPDKLYIPPSKLVLVDEASMIGPSVWLDLWKAAERHNLKVALVGDGFQLPPVAEKGAPPFSVLEPGFVSKLGGDTVELTEIVRQAEGSPVVQASMGLRLAKTPVEAATALRILPQVEHEKLLDFAVRTYQAGGVVICHTNVTRMMANMGIRTALGFTGGPTPGEPLLILRNNYDLDIYNGEQLTFDGWKIAPKDPTHVADKWSKASADVHFGAAVVAGHRCVLALEQLSGEKSIAEIGGWTLARAAEKWAKEHGLWEGAGPLPYVEANYGYALTAHKSQGSEWPYALVLVEPTVKLSTDEGRRWAYTAATRAKEMAAVFQGRV